MKNTTVLIIIMSTFTVAQSQFNEQHKVNSSYIKTMAIAKSKKGDKGSSYTKIKNKKELKDAITRGDLELKSETKGDRYIVIDIQNVHLNRRELKKLKEVNIGSNIKENGKIMQTINLKNLRIDTDKDINIGVSTRGNRRGSITTVTNIKNSQLGR